MSRLEAILAARRAALERARAARAGRGLPPLAEAAAPAGARRDFAAALRGPGRRIIAEIKRRSPSAGALREELDAAQIASDYARGGAAAISIVTEPDFFGGADGDLAAVRARVDLPLLRKDFLVDRPQIFESRALGADAVLLIVRALPGPLLGDFLAAAAEAGLDALVEVHDEEELARAEDCGARLIGVNSRDLRDFSVDLGRTERLATRIPRGALGVAESGIHGTEDIQRLEAAGYHVFLVGESLLRARDPAGKLREFLA